MLAASVRDNYNVFKRLAKDPYNKKLRLALKLLLQSTLLLYTQKAATMLIQQKALITLLNLLKYTDCFLGYYKKNSDQDSTGGLLAVDAMAIYKNACLMFDRPDLIENMEKQ